MSEQSPAPSTAPWVTAAVAVVLTLALTVLLVLAINGRNNREHAAAAAAPAVGALTTDQQTAVTTAATEAVNLLSFTRKSYAADFTRALNGTTGALRKDLSQRKASTLAAMTKGKFDLVASVAQSAFETQDGRNVTVLVTVNGGNVNDSGASTPKTPQRLELTMTKIDGKWLAANLVSVGIE